MLIFSRAPLFLWAEAIATPCFTQNRSIIHRRFNKTPYELINGKKQNISFLHVFEAICYPKNDRKDIKKLGAKGDIGFFIGYFADSCAYRVYNLRTKKIIKTMNVSFDELSAMAFEQRSSKPRLQSMTSGQIRKSKRTSHPPKLVPNSRQRLHLLHMDLCGPVRIASTNGKRNDHVAVILGFGDLQWGNILITRVYFIEGLGYNLFSVGQLCYLDLEVAFKRNACFVRNLEGVDLLKGDRSTNLLYH
nr:retrovirus-related Pol polyprotein from transposon TNT 1-94 [Tanacetum cinerariifolium]